MLYILSHRMSVCFLGALMLIAWMTTGSIGMIMARYMKSAAGKPILGKAIWYQVRLHKDPAINTLHGVYYTVCLCTL